MTSSESCVLSVSMLSNSSASKRGMPVTVSARYLPRLMSAGFLPACTTVRKHLRYSRYKCGCYVLKDLPHIEEPADTTRTFKGKSAAATLMPQGVVRRW